MWKNNVYIVDGKEVGKIWEREDPNWKWGYTGGFVARTKQEAMAQIEKVVKK